MTENRLFLIILAVYLILATAVSVIVPLGEAPDEADHYAYARYLVQNHALPQGPEITQGKHPPLYHTLAALAGGWAGMTLFLQPNPDALPIRTGGPANFFTHSDAEGFPWQDGPLAFHIARFLSALLGGVILWATWRIGKEAFPQRPEIGLLSAAFLAGLPGFIYISGAMNNDNAAGAFGALALLLMVHMLQKGLSWPRTLALGAVFGLGLLSKVGTLSLWPLLALATVGAIWPARRQARAWMIAGAHTAAAWGFGGLLASPWLLRNWRLYGDPLGWALVRQTVDMRETPVDFSVLAWLFKGLYTYFWGRYGAIGQIFLPNWVYLLAGVFTLAVIIGIFSFLRRGYERLRADKDENVASVILSDQRERRISRLRTGRFPSTLLRTCFSRYRSFRMTQLRYLRNKRTKVAVTNVFILLLLAGAPLLVALGIIRYTAIALGTDQARLLWPGLAAIAVWFGVGLTGLYDLFGFSQRLTVARQTLITLLVSSLFGLLVLILLVRPAFL